MVDVIVIVGPPLVLIVFIVAAVAQAMESYSAWKREIDKGRVYRDWQAELRQEDERDGDD